MPEDLTTATVATRLDALEVLVFVMAEILIEDEVLEAKQLVAGPQRGDWLPELRAAINDTFDRLADHLGVARPERQPEP